MTPPRWCQFLQPLLQRRPQELELCGQPPTPAAAADCADMQQLRCFKYRELLKLCTLVEVGSGSSIDSEQGSQVKNILDSSPAALPPQQLLQRSDWLTERVLHLQSELAIHILRRAMALHFADQLQPCVLAYGKLGAAEINFSSDIDIVFLAPDAADFAAGESQYKRWFDDVVGRIKLLVRELEQRTEEGFLYRVDLRLRPWGDAGPLLTSFAAMENYYAGSADAWERIALLRARAVAGDMELGHSLLQQLRSFLYPRHISMDNIKPLFDIKQRMQNKRNRKGAWDVKTGAGGIRDVEFFVHIMQLLHGAGHECLRSTRTLELLHHLGRLGVIDSNKADAAMDSYLFLRAVENALQMEQEQQRHHLPQEADAVAALAEMLLPHSASPLQEFNERLAAAREVASGLFTCLLPQEEQPEAVADASEKVTATPVWDVVAAANSMQRWQDMVREQQPGATPELPAEAVSENDDSLLRSIFGASWYCTRYLFYCGPEGFPPLHLDTPESMSLRTASPADMEQLRHLHTKTIIRILSWDLRLAPAQQELEQRLSLLARRCFRHIVGLMQHQYPVLKDLVVMAMGRLAVSEMNYGSDLDLVFLYTGAKSDLAKLRVAIAALLRECQLPESAGRLYQVDTRLRPYGGSGSLVTGVNSFRSYHTGVRETWERQAMTRCRILCGPDKVASELLTDLNKVIYKPSPAETLAEDIYTLRMRVERDLGHPGGRIDIKRGCGGIMDIDFIAHYLQLLHGWQHPSLRLAGTRQCLRYAAACDLCPLTADLLAAYDLLKRVEGRLRVFDMEATSVLPDNAARMTAIARGSMQSTGADPAGNLSSTIEKAMQTVRARFKQFMGQ